MRSFGEYAQPRPRAPIRLWLLVAGEDHPRACTGRRLVHLGRAIRSRGSTPPPVYGRARPVRPDPALRGRPRGRGGAGSSPSIAPGTASRAGESPRGRRAASEGTGRSPPSVPDRHQPPAFRPTGRAQHGRGARGRPLRSRWTDAAAALLRGVRGRGGLLRDQPGAPRPIRARTTRCDTIGGARAVRRRLNARHLGTAVRGSDPVPWDRQSVDRQIATDRTATASGSIADDHSAVLA